MESDREINAAEDQLRSNSLEEIQSCSSSILNSPQSRCEVEANDFDDDDDYEDGINVTLLSTSFVNESAGNHSKARNVEELNTPSAKGGICGIDGTAKSVTLGAKTPKDDVPNNDKKKMKRLNGAGKKRFKYLVAHGHNSDEARIMAEKPFKIPYSDPAKRRRNAELNESNNSESNPPKKVAYQASRIYTPKSSVQTRLDQARMSDLEETSHSKGPNNGNSNVLSYRDVLNSVRVGILPAEYPNTELTKQQLIATQKAILINVAQQRKERVKPKFGNCLFRPGHMILVCRNQDTANWLKATISSIKPWDNASLVAVDEKDIPRPEILSGFFPRSEEESTDDILAFVESQNEGLNVDAWKILKRYTVKQHHVELVFTVDDVSMKTLVDCKFTVDYKFGVAYIRKKVSSKPEINEAGKITESTSDGQVGKDAKKSNISPEDIEMSDSCSNQEGAEDSNINDNQSNECYEYSAITEMSNRNTSLTNYLKDNGHSLQHDDPPIHGSEVSTKKREGLLEYRQIQSHPSQFTSSISSRLKKQNMPQKASKKNE